MSNDVKTKNDEEIRLFFSAGDRMMKRMENSPACCISTDARYKTIEM